MALHLIESGRLPCHCGQCTVGQPPVTTAARRLNLRPVGYGFIYGCQRLQMAHHCPDYIVQSLLHTAAVFLGMQYFRFSHSQQPIGMIRCQCHRNS